MKRLVISSILILTFFAAGCGIYKTAVNASRLKFKLGKITNATLADIPIDNKTSLRDFDTGDLLKVTSAFARENMMLTFTLNVDAMNPNDGKGGYSRTDFTITHLRWRLFVDDKETVFGDIERSVQIPGTAEIIIIPIQVNLDMIKFFGNRGFDSLVKLALSVAGKKGSSSKVTLYVRPTVSSFLGEISYPGELKVVEKQFTN